MLSKMTRHAKESFKTRPKRVIPADLASSADISRWSQQSTYEAHKTTHPRVNSLRVSGQNPNWVLSGGEDHQVLLYDVSSQRVERRFEGHSKPVRSVLLVESGNSRAVVSGSEDRTVRVWQDGGLGGSDRRVEERPTILRVHSGEVTGLALQPTGAFFVSCGRDGVWAFYDLAAGRLVQTVGTAGGAGREDARAMETVEFHPDGLILATGMREGAVQVWDMKTQSSVASFGEPGAAVEAVAFSENGYYMASGGEEGRVRVWDLRNGECVKEWEAGAAVHALQFDASGCYLGVGAETVSVWESKTWEKVWECAEAVGGVHCLAFGEKAQYLLAGCGNRSIARFSLWCVCWNKQKRTRSLIAADSFGSDSAETRDASARPPSASRKCCCAAAPPLLRPPERRDAERSCSPDCSSAFRRWARWTARRTAHNTPRPRSPRTRRPSPRAPRAGSARRRRSRRPESAGRAGRARATPLRS